MLKHCSTSLPSNCDDPDLSAKPAFEITTSTYMIVMAKISMLIPGLIDGLFSLPSLFERYEHVINVDRQMRALVSQIPTILLNKARDNDDSNPPWLDLARRTLAIAAADKIIMIHRHFLLRSFESPLYLFTAKTCVSAAMTILREHKSLSDSTSKCIPIWSHSAFCITAVVVLCLDMLHGWISRQNHEHQRSLVTQARARLSTHVTDTMARRGVHLIDAMLDEDSHATGRSDLQPVFESFWALDAQGSHSQREPCLDPQYDFTHLTHPEDFDERFYQAFQIERDA